MLTTTIGRLLPPILGLALATLVAAQDQQPDAKRVTLDNPFYAFNNSMRGRTPADSAGQAELLAELGYDGFEGHDLGEVPRLAEELHRRGLRMSTIYLRADIDAEERPYDPRIVEYLGTFLKDRGVILTVHLHSERFEPSDPAGDERAVPILRELADIAHECGASVAVYNHARFWAESVDDGIRLAKAVNRRNFGAAFNLCHWLHVHGDGDLGACLDRVMPYLLSVSICGAEGGAEAEGAGWNRLIQPLDQGSFDTYALVAELVRRGYAGPFGLQCYNVQLPAEDLLARSMRTWRAFQRRFRAESRSGR